MLLLQAMIGVPFFIVALIAIITAAVYEALRILHRLYNSLETDEDIKTRKREKSKKLHFWLALLTSLAVCAYYIYAISVGPQIN